MAQPNGRLARGAVESATQPVASEARARAAHLRPLSLRLFVVVAARADKTMMRRCAYPSLSYPQAMVFACFDALLAHFDGKAADGPPRYPDAHWHVPRNETPGRLLFALRLRRPPAALSS